MQKRHKYRDRTEGVIDKAKQKERNIEERKREDPLDKKQELNRLKDKRLFRVYGNYGES